LDKEVTLLRDELTTLRQSDQQLQGLRDDLMINQSDELKLISKLKQEVSSLNQENQNQKEEIQEKTNRIDKLEFEVKEILT
jgi:hypothetical protein